MVALLSAHIYLDYSLHIPLQQRHTHLLSLRARWSNPLTSEQAFDRQIQWAFEITQSLQVSSLTLPDHLSPLSYPISEPWAPLHEQLEDVDDDDHPESPAPTTEDILFADYLTHELNEEGTEDETVALFSLLSDVNVTLVWKLPVRCNLCWH